MKNPLLISRRMALGGLCAALAGILRARAADAPTARPRPREPRMVDWMELLPEKERRLAEEADSFVHDYLGEDGPPMKQRGSFITNPALNGAFVKVPGFVVPMAMTRQGVVAEFLLVPYFGACIHVPPPPPNQIVYVKLQTPARIRTIWDPYWASGILSTRMKDTQMASAAYSLAGEKLEPYEY